jgi:hypothetical protein
MAMARWKEIIAWASSGVALRIVIIMNEILFFFVLLQFLQVYDLREDELDAAVTILDGLRPTYIILTSDYQVFKVNKLQLSTLLPALQSGSFAKMTHRVIFIRSYLYCLMPHQYSSHALISISLSGTLQKALMNAEASLALVIRGIL